LTPINRVRGGGPIVNDEFLRRNPILRGMLPNKDQPIREELLTELFVTRTTIREVPLRNLSLSPLTNSPKAVIHRPKFPLHINNRLARTQNRTNIQLGFRATSTESHLLLRGTRPIEVKISLENIGNS
jgi:hypothetical protein